ncbi:MAG: hypothetical protein C0454_15635 [Parvibaculum sp.]|nr:hypothetical protein [Parvibaculum sp.]
MRTYGQFCPVAKAAELFCERWTALIIRDLSFGATRFSQLRRGVPLASPTLLSRRLKELEVEGVIERRRSENGRIWTYHLTPAGEEFVPIVEALGIWGQKWSRRELAKHEMDVTVLLWGLETHVDASAFGDRRCVVQLTLTDQPRQRRDWWFVHENGRAEMCLEEPGFDVDLYLTSSLRDMIYIYRGDLPLSRAQAERRLEAHGAAWARRALSRWLAPDAMSSVKSQRLDAKVA